MAFELHRPGFQHAFYCASNIASNIARVPVKLSASSADTVLAAGTNADRPFGMVGGPATRAEHVTVYEEGNYVKAIAVASLGANTEVTIASSNGALGPDAPIAASGHWAVGISMSAAGAGEVFTLYVKPRKA